MIIRYLGHSAFFIKGEEFSVVTDPYSGIGRKMEKVTADYCLSSHNHYDHNYFAGVDCKRIITVPDKKFCGIESFHDSENGRLRGRNTIFKFVLDNVVFCHMGDIGEYVSSRLIDEIGYVDVLFIPIGGNYTIDWREAVKYIQEINPKIVFPMHYKTHDSNMDLDTVDKFAKHIAGVERIDNEIKISKDDLPLDTAVYIMTAANFDLK